MNLLLTGHHLELTPAIRQYVEEKLERVARHFDAVLETEVILTLETTAEKGQRQRAETNLRLKGETLHAEGHADDLYAAIDAMVDKLQRQVSKHKGKIQDHNHTPSKHLQP